MSPSPTRVLLVLTAAIAGLYAADLTILRWGRPVEAEITAVGIELRPPWFSHGAWIEVRAATNPGLRRLQLDEDRLQGLKRGGFVRLRCLRFGQDYCLLAP